MSLDDHALDVLFRNARSQNGWTDEPVSDETIHALYELLKFGPTAANCCPARFVFLRSAEAKERLRPTLAPGNVQKMMTAPVIAIVGSDQEFWREIPKLFPHYPQMADTFANNAALAATAALRNSSFQGAYLMLAARALGLDAGPIGGFDSAAVDARFFEGTAVKTNFIVGLGHGDPVKVHPRLPRLSFDEAAKIL